MDDGEPEKNSTAELSVSEKATAWGSLVYVRLLMNTLCSHV